MFRGVGNVYTAVTPTVPQVTLAFLGHQTSTMSRAATWAATALGPRRDRSRAFIGWTVVLTRLAVVPGHTHARAADTHPVRAAAERAGDGRGAVVPHEPRVAEAGAMLAEAIAGAIIGTHDLGAAVVPPEPGEAEALPVRALPVRAALVCTLQLSHTLGSTVAGVAVALAVLALPVPAAIARARLALGTRVPEKPGGAVALPVGTDPVLQTVAVRRAWGQHVTLRTLVPRQTMALPVLTKAVPLHRVTSVLARVLLVTRMPIEPGVAEALPVLTETVVAARGVAG